ncbi:hypothetical protein GO986_12645 [Deinococcus sp. HMF7620]|uniref:site-specific DNA-methyltransferase (adenine-specific) n=1 Tax=Deinococcus arboris TaxID=2682977 RepID=A0A7C9I029_9DEIO|nr:DNA methyltransferase [Deinococcus arboris]MVN87615.1 hypothetical protein [Deinococcus arboris]
MTDQAPSPQALRKALQAPDLRPLFTEELGWDNPQGGSISEEADGQTFTFTPLARKVNFVVYRASPTQDGKLPGRDIIRKLERKLDAKAAERLVIYSNAGGDQALWVRHKKEQGKAASLYTVEYKRGLRNEALIYYLKSLYVSLDEDLNGLTTIDVARKASNIEIEKVTKKFYKEFDRIRSTFKDQIAGVEGEDREHYAGLTLNRLMFVYFIQKKEYLDGDLDYLRNRLKKVQAQRGSGKFQSFYRAFLLRLFHEGLGAVPHDPALTSLIGKVPYLNGGLFEEHRIEQENGAIEIPDAAFEKVFAFFEGWRWTIDERAEAEADESGKPEINPDVLGYIFEQYINNKQMGAYYTKEDITEYISKNTILPFVLKHAREDCRVAFEGERTVWDLLKENPDRYIHAAIRKGSEYELPEHIKAGLDPNQPDLLKKREAWNKRADDEYALPTEIWREVVARRNRYAEVRGKLERGEVQSVPELITLNLDIITFAQDVIRYAEGSELIRAIWKAIITVTVLDPACGSGAFLFAAAGILAPLYHLCLERMAGMVAALAVGDNKLPDFREVLAEQTHHDPQYYVLKQIIIRNLYGVDIMAEAVEIAKLRLFLKLMAFSQKDDYKPNMGLEPLPDIDFNIRTGNTLVGYATREEAEHAVRGALLSTSAVTWEQIEEKAGEIDLLEELFREQQLKRGGQVTPANKKELRDRLVELEALLNSYLAADYGIDEKKKPGSFEAWRKSHQPFHWFIEFHHVMGRGGFDCIVGNPPYVAASSVGYKILGKKYPDIYANVSERSLALSRSDGTVGLIVPISLMFSDGFFDLRKKISSSGYSYFSTFDILPSPLFTGAAVRCTIFMVSKGIQPETLSTTRMYRWRSVFRPYLMEVIEYGIYKDKVFKRNEFIRSSNGQVLSVVLKLFDGSTQRHGGSKIGYGKAALNFISAFTTAPPNLDLETLESVPSNQVGWLNIPSRISGEVALASLVGELYLTAWLAVGDGFHVTSGLLNDYLANISKMNSRALDLLRKIGIILGEEKNLALRFKSHAGYYVGNYNYRSLHDYTRRADLIILSNLGLNWLQAVEIFDNIQRVLAVNELAGEKGIPTKVKSMFPISLSDKTKSILNEVDAYIMEQYNIDEDQLNYVLLEDIGIWMKNS